jgi:nucleotide-binding universal stress UspA family protein
LMSVVVGFIPNPQGEAALELAVSEAKMRGVSLVVANFGKNDAYVDDRSVTEPGVEELQTRLASLDVPYSIVAAVGESDTASDLLSLAETSNATLIVIGIRRRSQVGKLLLGSVAQRVIMEAPCPVLTVRP